MYLPEHFTYLHDVCPHLQQNSVCQTFPKSCVGLKSSVDALRGTPYLVPTPPGQFYLGPACKHIGQKRSTTREGQINGKDVVATQYP